MINLLVNGLHMLIPELTFFHISVNKKKIYWRQKSIDEVKLMCFRGIWISELIV